MRGLSVAIAAWQIRQVLTLGSPACGPFVTLSWQYLETGQTLLDVDVVRELDRLRPASASPRRNRSPRRRTLGRADVKIGECACAAAVYAAGWHGRRTIVEHRQPAAPRPQATAETTSATTR